MSLSTVHFHLVKLGALPLKNSGARTEEGQLWGTRFSLFHEWADRLVGLIQREQRAVKLEIMGGMRDENPHTPRGIEKLWGQTSCHSLALFQHLCKCQAMGVLVATKWYYSF